MAYFPAEYFVRGEFACKCGCGFDTVDAELLRQLDRLRHHFDSPTVITSGCRCRGYNKLVGGASGSKHLEGKAADLQVSGVSPEEVYNYLDSKFPGMYGLGLYKTWVHFDVRSQPARWQKKGG